MTPTAAPEGMKYCPRCRSTQPLRNFNSDKSKKSGVRSWCKECFKTSDSQKKGQYKVKAKRYRSGNLTYWTKL